MKNKRKSLVTVTGLLIIFAMLLAGCGGQNSGATESQTAATSAQSSESSSGKSNTIDVSQLPETALSVVLVGSEQKDIAKVQEKISDLTKEKINATVKITTIPFSNWTQQTSLMISSGEPIDLLWTSSFYNYNSNAASGQFYELDELLAKYGQGVLDSMDQKFIDSARVNGKAYAVPAIRDFAADYGFIIRKDILDKYSIDISKVKSPEDMTAIYEIVYKNEPNMKGFTSANPNTYTEIFGQTKYDKLGDWLGVIELNDSTYKVVNWFETDTYKELLYLVRGWQEKGYISKDAATVTDIPETLVGANQLFSFPYNGKPGIAAQESKKSRTEVVWVPFSNAIATTGTITNGMVSIPITSKDPERAMMLMNLWYSDPALVNLFDNGIEGVHYVKNAEGLLTYPQGVDASNATYIPITWRIGNNFLADIWDGNDPNLWKQMEEFNNGAQQSVALGFTFNTEPVKTEVAAVNNVISGYKMALETGTLDVDKVLPEFNAKLKDAGIEKIIAEKQAQLTAWAAAQ